MEPPKTYIEAIIFSTYIKTINHENIARPDNYLGHERYVNKLFSIFGANGDQAKNWLAGGNKSFLKRFRDLTIEKKHLLNCFKFFKGYIKCDIHDLQIELAKNTEWFKYVNTLTSDSDVFFCSLITQFLYIVKPSTADDEKLQDVISQITDKANPENSFAFQMASSKLMKETFFYGISKYKVAYYMNHLNMLINSTYSRHLPAALIFLDDSISKEPDFDIFDTLHYDWWNVEMENMTSSEREDDMSLPGSGPEKYDNIDYTEMNLNFYKDIDNFIDYIYFKITTTFTPYQYESTYLLIDNFCSVLKKFVNSFKMIRGKLKQEIYDTKYDRENLNSYFSQLQREIDTIKFTLDQLESRDPDQKSLNSKISTHYFLQEQINVLLSVLSYRDEICTLFEKISDGVPLLLQKKR